MGTTSKGTGRLNARPDTSVYMPKPLHAAGTATTEAIKFRQVPAVVRPQYAGLVWRILLKPMAHSGQQMALELRGDVIMGVADDGQTPLDIDLSVWQGRRYGVSRRHLTLRPSFNKLYVIDLGSTNGTFVNALPIGRSWAYAIKDQDVLSLGKLNLRLSIVKEP
jgi:hypothetical protein